MGKVLYRMLFYDAKRAFDKKWIVVGMVSMAVVVFLTKLDVIVETVRNNTALEHGFTIELITGALTGEAMLFLLPVLCTLPYASAFIDEYKSGIIRFSLTRVERKKYLLSKVAAAVLSGGAILVTGALAVVVLFAVLFFRLEESVQKTQGLAEMLFPVFQILVRYFFLGGLWSMTGMFISTATSSRYMAWIGPFMMEYLLIIFCERYWQDCYILYPKEWLAPLQRWPMDLWSICMWLLGLILFTAWAYMRSAIRRLNDA